MTTPRDCTVEIHRGTVNAAGQATYIGGCRPMSARPARGHSRPLVVVILVDVVLEYVCMTRAPLSHLASLPVRAPVEKLVA